MCKRGYREAKRARKAARIQAVVQQNKCFWCYNEMITNDAQNRNHNHAAYITADHVVPYSRGGASTIENIVAAHQRCNVRRANDMPTFKEVLEGVLNTYIYSVDILV